MVHKCNSTPEDGRRQLHARVRQHTRKIINSHNDRVERAALLRSSRWPNRAPPEMKDHVSHPRRCHSNPHRRWADLGNYTHRRARRTAPKDEGHAAPTPWLGNASELSSHLQLSLEQT